MNRTTRPYIIAFVLAMTACATLGNTDQHRDVAGSGEIVIGEMEYDAKGLPIIPDPLDKRPSKTGEHFTVVKLSQGRPYISSDIMVLEPKPEFLKPLQVVYEWTGKGFKWGVQTAEAMVDAAAHEADFRSFAIAMIISPVPVTAGAAGGFVMGLGDGIRQTVIEVNKLIVSEQEVQVTFTTYEYDDLSRLVVLRMFSPDKYQLLVRTEFFYTGDSRVPSRSQITDMIEGKVKVWE